MASLLVALTPGQVFHTLQLNFRASTRFKAQLLQSTTSFVPVL